MKQIRRSSNTSEKEEENKRFRQDSETMGAVVSILNNPASNFINLPIARNSDIELKDEDNLLLPPNQAEF